MKNKEKLVELKKIYEEIKDNINLEKANGNLSKLVNLRAEFDETFDIFFDDKELRLKYNAWSREEDTINTDFSNTDLENMLDDEDIEKLCEFYNSYISDLEFELQELEDEKEE